MPAVTQPLADAVGKAMGTPSASRKSTPRKASTAAKRPAAKKPAAAPAARKRTGGRR